MVAVVDMPTKKKPGRPKKPGRVPETSVRVPEALKKQLTLTMKWRGVNGMSDYLTPVLQQFADAEEAEMAASLNAKLRARGPA